ncbi:MAG: hypothetical protein WBB86_06695 [Candidatus Omnitrophota bacterium]
MNATLFIAKMFGLYIIIMTSIMLLRRGLFQKFMEDFSKNYAVVFLTGIFTLFFGLAIILTHNIWVMNWTVIITIFGWLALIKGIWFLAFPDSLSKFTDFYTEAKVFPVVHAVVGLLFGIYLTYMGFFAG